MGLQTFYLTVGHPLLWYDSRAAKYNQAGRDLETLGFVVSESLTMDRQVWRSQ
jgi:hypothetical protein